jgi:hypothetical protein
MAQPKILITRADRCTPLLKPFIRCSLQSSLIALARTRRGDVIKAAPARNKTKLKKRTLDGTFHQLKQLAEALRSKLSEQLFLFIPLLQITERVRVLNFSAQLHPAAATSQPGGQHNRM